MGDIATPMDNCSGTLCTGSCAAGCAAGCAVSGGIGLAAGGLVGTATGATGAYYKGYSA